MESLFDVVSCIIQLIVLAVLVFWSARQRGETWLFQIITGAFGCYFLGTLFWTLFYFIRDDWPSIFTAADLSFIGYYCFFIAAALGLKGMWSEEERDRAGRGRAAAFVSVFVVLAAHVAYVLLAGGLVNNILFFIPLAFLFYYTVSGIFASGVYRRYHNAVLIVFVLELLIFLVSSFGWNSLYYVFTYIQMAAWFLIIPAAKKGAEA